MALLRTQKSFERLPVNVLPHNYHLELKPDLAAFTFEGRLEITTEVVQSTSVVVMNCAEIEIQSAHYLQGDLKALIAYDVEGEMVSLQFPYELPVGVATLAISYTGILNNQMRGLYRSKYSHPAKPNQERFGASTQFENEVSCEEIGGGLKKVTFARTPIMSTYLLAFIVGEYDYVEATDVNGVRVRVFTPLGKVEEGRFALDMAVQALPFYQDYFSTAYPLKKLDLIALQDYAAIAMENWGLVTFRDRLLLVNPSSSISNKQRVAILVGHELAHQWFGNLVTMEWWTHLWLKEGFATWIEYLCVSHTHPDYHIWNLFLSREYTSALRMDALTNSHPIEVSVGHSSEVGEIFDDISYSKGSCVIRMLHNWIGEESFRKGLNLYLTKFAYKNASTDDLWVCLEESNPGKQIAMVMSTWTQQMGYPVVSVERKQVPITIATKKNAKAVQLVLSEESASVTVEGVGDGDWVLVNPERVGYYRVCYGPELFSALTPALSDRTLSSMDRLGLQDDAFALARAGVCSTMDFLSLLPCYCRESEFTVWESLCSNLGTLDRILSYTSYYNIFNAFACKLFDEAVARLGWDARDTDTPSDILLRSLVIACHGCYGSLGTIAEAKSRFQKHVDGTQTLTSDLKTAVYTMALVNGDDNTFDQLLMLHDASDSSEERNRIYRCLGCGRTTALTRRCLEFSISDKVRPNDIWSILCSAAYASPQSRDMVWEFVKDNWTVLKERYQGTFLLGRIVDISTFGFVTEEKAREIEKFFRDHPCSAVDRIVKQNCEDIRLNCQWLERDYAAIEEWLKGSESTLTYYRCI